MVEPVGRFAKAPNTESFLENLNRQLAPGNDAEYRDRQEQYPTLQIIGVPRSGTTLLGQLVAGHLDVGYIDHLVAAFWRAPLYGIRMSRLLLDGVRPNTYSSEYGRTEGIQGPHEFGYFWRDLLAHDEFSESAALAASPDWKRVRNVVTNMCAEFERPIVFKAFQLVWHMEQFQQALPLTRFVWVRRDPLETAMSILRLREGFAGSRDSWVSMKPLAYNELKDRPRAEQVVGQVYEIEQTISQAVARLAPDTVLEVPLSRLRRDPGDVLDDCRHLLHSGGADVPLLRPPPASFPSPGLDTADPDYPAVRDAVALRYPS
jgi:hypothetical protein